MWALNGIIRAINSINEWVGRTVAWLMVAMVLNVFLVVVLRYVIGFGAIWMQEAYVWSHAVVFLLGAGYTLAHDGHVRIDLIYRGASARYKAIINMAGCVVFAGPVLHLIFLKSLPMVERSWRIHETSAEAGGLPGLFLLKSVILVFSVLFGLQFLALFLRSLQTLLGYAEPLEFTDPDDGEIKL